MKLSELLPTLTGKPFMLMFTLNGLTFSSETTPGRANKFSEHKVLLITSSDDQIMVTIEP